MATTVHPLQSSKPDLRRAHADQALANARAEVSELTCAWENRDRKADREELRVLRERLQGAKAELGNWLLYIKCGYPKYSR